MAATSSALKDEAKLVHAGESSEQLTMGILCENCGALHPINAATKSGLIVPMPRSAGSGMFILTCADCASLRSFHKSDLRPYGVTKQQCLRGYARRGQYSLQRI